MTQGGVRAAEGAAREEEPGLCFPVDDMTEGGKERRQEKTNLQVFFSFLYSPFLTVSASHSV